MPTEGERLSTLEAQLPDLMRRMAGLEAAMDRLTEATNKHVFKSTCVNGGAKVLQGASAGGGVLLAVYVVLEKLGVI
jgi:hypothetical protein